MYKHCCPSKIPKLNYEMVYSHVSLPKKYKRRRIYTMRNGGCIFYNMVLSGYIPELNKKFGIEISGIGLSKEDISNYAKNKKYTIIQCYNKYYVIEISIRDTNEKPRQRYNFYYKHFDIPRKVYNSLIIKMNELTKQ
jgi:hypothetical protein